MASTQHDIAVAFLDSFKELDGDANLALRTADCSHVMAPASMNYSPSMTNDQWLQHLSALKPILSNFPVTAKEMFEHEGSKQITIWATSDAIFRDEVKDEDPMVDWSYHGEYIFILCFNETGDKIQRIVEFLDSKKVAAIGELMKRARNNLAAKKETAS